MPKGCDLSFERCNMKRLEKAMLLPVRRLAYRWNKLRLYYWADAKLFELRHVNVMPSLYYHVLYQ